MSETYEMTMQVRDYECDMQGIVNNATYLNYLEHTRHEYAKSQGNSFKDRTERGEFFVVGRIDITYRRPLKSGDEFLSRLRVETAGSRKRIFHQELLKPGDERPLVAAKVSVYQTSEI